MTKKKKVEQAFWWVLNTRNGDLDIAHTREEAEQLVVDFIAAEPALQAKASDLKVIHGKCYNVDLAATLVPHEE